MRAKIELRQLQANVRWFQSKTIDLISLPELSIRLATYLWSSGQHIHPEPVSQYLPTDLATLQRFLDFYLPFHIAVDFPNVPKSSIRRLAIGSAHLHLYGALLDYILDASFQSAAKLEVITPYLLFQAQRILANLFPIDSIFWKKLDLLLTQTSWTLLSEQPKPSSKIEACSLSQYRRSAHKKMALAKTNVIGLAILNGTPDRISALNVCWNALMFLATLDDDVIDWVEDYQEGKYTFLLTQILLSEPFRADVDSGRMPNIDEVGAALFCSDTIERLYLEAAENLQQAELAISQFNCPAITNLLRVHRDKTLLRANTIVANKIGALISM